MNEFMKAAIDLSNDNICGGPFGACIVKNEKIIGKASNKVIKNNDPTAHAEIEAIREACKTINSYDLSGCELYTSCYPCPMCLSAIIWANIKKVYYANTKDDASDIGFMDNAIYDFIRNGMKDDSIVSFVQIDRESAIKIFEEYTENKDKIEY